MEIKRMAPGHYQVTAPNKYVDGHRGVIAWIMRLYVPEQRRFMWRLSANNSVLWSPTLAAAKSLARDIYERKS